MGYYIESPMHRAKRVRKAVDKRQAWALASYTFKHEPVRRTAFANIEHNASASIYLRSGWRLKFGKRYHG